MTGGELFEAIQSRSETQKPFTERGNNYLGQLKIYTVITTAYKY